MAAIRFNFQTTKIATKEKYARLDSNWLMNKQFSVRKMACTNSVYLQSYDTMSQNVFEHTIIPILYDAVGKLSASINVGKNGTRNIGERNFCLFLLHRLKVSWHKMIVTRSWNNSNLAPAQRHGATLLFHNKNTCRIESAHGDTCVRQFIKRTNPKNASNPSARIFAIRTSAPLGVGILTINGFQPLHAKQSSLFW